MLIDLILSFLGDILLAILSTAPELFFQLAIDALVELWVWATRKNPIPEPTRIPTRLVFADISIWIAFLVGSAVVFLPCVKGDHSLVQLFLAMIICGAMGWLAASTRTRAARRMGRRTWRRRL